MLPILVPSPLTAHRQEVFTLRNRPLKSQLSQSHGGGLIFHGLLSVGTTNLPSHTTGSFNPFWEP